MEYDESPQMTRSQPGIEQRFLKRQQVASQVIRHPYPEIHENPSKSMKIFENQWKSIKIDGNL